MMWQLPAVSFPSLARSRNRRSFFASGSRPSPTPLFAEELLGIILSFPPSFFFFLSSMSARSRLFCASGVCPSPKRAGRNVLSVLGARGAPVLRPTSDRSPGKDRPSLASPFVKRFPSETRTLLFFSLYFSPVPGGLSNGFFFLLEKNALDFLSYLAGK